MQYTIKINCDNSAFYGDASPEVARILLDLVNEFRLNGLLDMPLQDINGNTVGKAILGLGRPLAKRGSG